MANVTRHATFSAMKSKTISRASSPALASASIPPPPTRDQINALAHALWLDRGSPQGCDIEIWLEAERQLRGAKSPLSDTNRVDLETSEAARVDRELDRIVSPPEQRSSTAL
jgi:hypothetical protein